MDKKYAVMVVGASAPSKLHDNLNDAINEGKRLFKKHGSDVYILEATHLISFDDNLKVTDLSIPIKGPKPYEINSTVSLITTDTIGNFLKSK
jgi:hypothetical protein